MTTADSFPISDLNLLSIQGSLERTTSDVIFFLVLSGALDFRCGECSISASAQDVLMFTAREQFSVHGAGSNLALVVSLRSDFFAQGQSDLLGRFVCNSVDDHDRDYAPLRRVLAQLALARFESDDINGIHQRELAYSLVYYLNRYHYVPLFRNADGEETSQKYAKRYAQIVSYIEQNYSESISLDDLAGEVYLSPTYLSRFFRKHLGENFRSYLNRVRLEHAHSDLLHSDLTLTVISYNNGFPNLNTFNQLFQARYGVTPSQYRLERKLPPQTDSRPEETGFQHYALAERALNELAAQSRDAATSIQFPQQEVHCIEDVNVHTQVKPIWNMMINLGIGTYLNSHSLQSHIDMFQKEIGFRYGRIESVLNEKFLPTLPNGNYNFSNFDHAIETLLSAGLTPFLDLTNRSNYLLLNNQTFVYPSQKGTRAEAERQFLHKTSLLIRHCLNTFGASEVEHWGFEVGYLHGEYLIVSESPAAFVQRFGKCYRFIKELLPSALVGGISHNLSISTELFDKILGEMERCRFSPDFISVCGFPYEHASNSADPNRHIYSSDPEFMRNHILQIKQMLSGHPAVTQTLYLTVFGVDVMARNPLSDSCFQASYLVKNTFDLIGLVDLIGYWQLSDSGTEYTDSARMLFGGNGLISKHGLKKPGFTALKRMNNLSPHVIQRGNGYIATTNTRNTYHIMACNYIHFSDMFCMGDPSAISPEEVYSCFGSLSTKDFSIRLNQLPLGQYKIITTSLSRDNGSLLDEWLRYGIMDDLQLRDIHYFKDIVHPNRLARYAGCTDGSLEIHVQLLPHEVKFFEIFQEF